MAGADRARRFRIAGGEAAECHAGLDLLDIRGELRGEPLAEQHQRPARIRCPGRPRSKRIRQVLDDKDHEMIGGGLCPSEKTLDEQIWRGTRRGGPVGGAKAPPAAAKPP
jgi:hypothetical protein